MVKKINLKLILKYFACAFVVFVLSRAKVGDLSPFLYAFYFSCLYTCLDEKIVSVLVFAAGLTTAFTLENFLINITSVAVGLILFYVHKFSKRKIHLVSIFIGYLLSNATYVYYNFYRVQHLIYYLFLGVVCVFVYVVVLQVMLLRKNCFKLTLDESVCFLFVIASLGLGLASINIFSFSFAKFFIVLTLLICVSIGSPSLTYAVTLSFALGVSIYNMSLIPIGEFMLLALLIGVFSMPERLKIVFMLIVGDALVQYLFIDQTINCLYSIIPAVLASFIFILLPKGLLLSLADLVYVKKSEIASRNVINITRKNIKKRMAELSNVFLDMKNIHLNMTQKELTKEELTSMLTKEILSSSCRECIDKNRCTRSLGTDNKSNLETLIEIGINKGRVTLLDVPPGLSSRCVKVNNLIGAINRMIGEYKQYRNVMADVNNVKMLMAEQMGAVSRLMLDVGDEIDTNVRFDIARENKVISRLLSMNVYCKEVLLYTEKSDDISAMLVVKSADSYNPAIEKVVSEVLKTSMQITKITPLEESGFNSVLLRKKSRYDCVFGLAACNKSGNEESGDCHSIIRLGANKFLIALCDGMGAGESAHKMSAMTLGLIENFYKVGFDNDIILESVNKLLAINNQESYSTLDVCLIDLEKQLVDFIKVGAPFGLIKRENGIEVVEGGALPIGALETISPSTLKTTISTKDIVVLATDGITDAFETSEKLGEFISRLATNNPQTIAEAVLNEALTINNMSAKDDMTVLIARTYLK